MSALVRVEGVRWAPPSDLAFPREVLRGIDLEVHRGERIGIVGRSGAGKTTLVTILAGLLAPTAGRVVGAAEAGLVFQEAERGFFEETVLADVAFGAANRGATPEQAKDQARAALRTVGLDPDAIGGRMPETLSGGEARRAAIAGILAFAPSLVVLDEPTTGLDAEGVDRLHDLLGEIRRSGRAYVIVSHDLGFVAEECERVLLLEAGRIAWDGPAALLAEALPEDWRSDPALWGGEMPVIAAAMRSAGWIDESVPPTPDALATAWRMR
ncbi:MAG: energy-coupling factor ABC transporter ATP-binding protein [Candidatus Eiseniibacteriota bacterium]